MIQQLRTVSYTFFLYIHHDNILIHVSDYVVYQISDCVFTSAFSKPWKMKGQEFELKLVDTAGQDEYAIFPAQHSMDMHGYVMVYSITSLQSFELVQVLLEKIMDMTGKITSVFQLIFK